MVVWNNRMTDFYKNQTRWVDKFIPTGSLWSEHVREVQVSGKNPTLDKAVKHWGKKPSRIISVFDTTWNNHFPPSSIQHGINFLQSLLNYINENEEVYVMFKGKGLSGSSNPELQNKKYQVFLQTVDRKIQQFYNILEIHPRIYSESSLQSAPEEFIAAADVVVSAPFTSPTIEAIGAGKKAVFLDATGDMKGTYYTRFPNLVTWDLNVGIERATKQPFDTLDPYRDGKGITRFRELILKSD